MDFNEQYKKVFPIVRNTEKEFYIKLWDSKDWDQEGMIILYKLLSDHPELVDNEPKMCTYFKVKFRNYIKDIIRAQESQKRKFDRMPHEEVSNIAYEVKDKGLVSDEMVMLRGMLNDYRSVLNKEKRLQFDQLISGQNFKGKKAMLRDLEDYLKDFRG